VVAGVAYRWPVGYAVSGLGVYSGLVACGGLIMLRPMFVDATVDHYQLIYYCTKSLC